MFGSMKKAMVVAAVVGVGAAAPAVASADQWKVGGVATGAITARAHGNLTLTSATGATTTCPVTGTLSLDNGGTAPNQARGSVTNLILGAGAGAACTTTVPNCTTVTATASGFSWPISTTGTSVTIGSVAFQNVYSGTGCALNGIPVNASGSLTGTAVGVPVATVFDTIRFASAGPLTTTVGAATVDGDLTITNTSGVPVALG